MNEPSTVDAVSTMISDLCHTGELSMLYRCEIGDTLTALRAALAARPDPIGAAWMREQAAIACNVVAAEAKEYNIPQMSLGASACCEAIRALPLPTDADLLAEAMKLPEVAALVDAISDAIDANPTELNLGNYDHDDVCRLQNEAIDVWQILSAALAPFTAAKETP